MSNNTGWTIEQTKRLFDLAASASKEGKSLSLVFSKMAQETGRQAGSVRNYYYSHLHTFSFMPEIGAKLGIQASVSKAKTFSLFEKGQAEKMVEDILVGLAKGGSVRSITHSMAGGDAKTALRLQNKYRSLVFKQKGRTQKIIDNLKMQNKEFYNPYTHSIGIKGDNTISCMSALRQIEEIASRIDNTNINLALMSLVNLIKQNVPASDGSHMKELSGYVGGFQKAKSSNF